MSELDYKATRWRYQQHTIQTRKYLNVVLRSHTQ